MADLRNGYKILDIGCGTGFVGTELAASYTNINYVGADISHAMCQKTMQTGNYSSAVACDMKSLPFSNSCFDIIISSLAVQWCDDLPLLYRELYRCAKPSGTVVISTLINGTLCELDACMKELFGYSSIKSLHHINQHLSSAKQAGFSHVEPAMETIIQPFASAAALIKNIILTGANTTESKLKLTRSKLHALNQLYALKYSTEEAMIASSWQIAYVQLGK